MPTHLVLQQYVVHFIFLKEKNWTEKSERENYLMKYKNLKIEKFNFLVT